MDIFYILVFAIVGLAVGSFLNVVADRLPNGESIVYPPSHCPACKHALAAKDLFPVFSYLLLRGRCRYCGKPIPKRLALIEAVTGAVFAYIYIMYGFSLPALAYAFYFCLFLVLLVIDLEHQIIPNKIIYPAIVVALIISALSPDVGIISALIGGGTGLVLFVIIAVASLLILKQEGMGWGDVKMVFLIGLITGFPRVLVAIYLAVISGGLVAIFLLVTHRKKKREGIPFAVFLSPASVLTILWGTYIVNLYLNLFVY